MYAPLSLHSQCQKQSGEACDEDQAFEFEESATNYSDTRPPQQKSKKDSIQPYLFIYITVPVLRYIFRFSYNALKRVRLPHDSKVPPVAHQLLRYLHSKLLAAKYVQKSAYPNRMKQQEKFKFIIRAYEHNSRLKVSNDPDLFQNRFNYGRVKSFFQRPQVSQNFREVIALALKHKHFENQAKIWEFQEWFAHLLDPSNTVAVAFEILDKIKRKQLPWTDNMFKDISQLSERLYKQHTGGDT